MTTLTLDSPKAPMLLTDTTPAEVPIIFSNRGLYEKVIGHTAYWDHYIGQVLIETFFQSHKGEPRETVPFKYNIHKSLESFRTLSLIHPANQVSLLDFYDRQAPLILYYCARSHFTLRAPSKLGQPSKVPKDWRQLASFRLSDASEELGGSSEAFLGHFFRYRGYSRIYKFFGSSEFIELEQKYKHLYLMDVSDCFNSVYTHSLAWAVKSLPYMKSPENRGADTFGQEFDSFIRKANSSETNGIVIGPEFSRIFAEIIFQAIDIDSEREILSEFCLKRGVHYEIRRYVDDVFVFGDSKRTADHVALCYGKCLGRYKLSFNNSKTQKYERPFVTAKSRLIRDVELQVSRFLRSFLDESKTHPKVRPKDIGRLQRMVSEFVNRIKNVCSYNDMDYEGVSGYIIGILSARVKTLVSSTDSGELDADNELRYARACTALVKAAFYFYHVAPTVQSSYRISASCVILKRYADQVLGAHAFAVHQVIFEEATSFLLSAQVNHGSLKDSMAISLERLNLLLVLTDFSKDYLPPKGVIQSHLEEDQRLSYFEIICFLYVIKDRADLASERMLLSQKIDEKIASLEGGDLKNDSEGVHLIFDVLSCPFVDEALKRRCIRAVFRSVGMDRPSGADIADFLAEIKEEYWFVRWSEGDILFWLQEKEQRAAY